MDVVYDLEQLPAEQQFVLYETDANGREIRIFELQDVQAVGQQYYPGVKLFTFQHSVVYNPTRESIMSIPNAVRFHTEDLTRNTIDRIEKCPVFFFVYNVDNYYHFLYDTLPYLITYLQMRSEVPELKLLINFASDQQAQLNRFVIEFLELLNIDESDLVVIDDKTLYNTVYVSSSYTHDGKSNAAPRAEVYDLYKQLADKIECDASLPQKIYISRRSHKHGNYDNIGTNYTSRRLFANEDALVSLLESQGYTEIFTELLSTKEKIALFKNCTHVVGPIGGGLCNVLFSRPETKLVAIVSPHFLDINGRFCHSFAYVDTTYFKHTKHVEDSWYKKHMRVRIPARGIVGEITQIENDLLSVMYSREMIAGWNAMTEYEQIWVSGDEVEIVDPGLNSAWMMDMEEFANVSQ